ncbi:MAG: hypothetical protein V5A77_06785 [Candidatus Bipolaricaulota bacterium]|nr:hypothetical protein [Candidatus Bipolaricaulota bacterium]MBS3792561.1 hypothetical protein [Candidatus Bipolaricaulota bacterium]
MFIEKLARVSNLFFQWWLTSDQILFRRFLNHEAMIFSLAVALGINLWGLFVLYVPINILLPDKKIRHFRAYLRLKFPWFRRHLARLNNFSDSQGNSYMGILKSKEKRGKVISRLIDTYGYDYLTVFGLSFFPIPFLGTLMTGAALFAIEALEIRFGLAVIIFAKVAKVFSLASVAYFAYFL